MKIKHGFLVYENGNDEITWVAPHSGPSLETPTSRDDNSDTVASLCWMKIGGKLIVSTMPRKRMMGIDFNRDAPPMRKSIKYYEWFRDNKNPEDLQEYREKYAWVSKNRVDYARRLKIYKDFWDEIKASGRTVVFIHRKFTRLKNFPSAMDLVAYRDYGFSRQLLKKTVERVNKKHGPLLQKISKNYKNAIIMEEQRVIERVLEVFGNFDLSNIDAEYRGHMMGDIDKIRKMASPKIVKSLEKNFTPANLMMGVRSALRNGGDIEVTLESIFKGEKAIGKIKSISRSKNVIQIESNAFMNYWYPNETSDIILDIVNEIKPMMKITNYLKEKSWPFGFLKN